MSIHDPDKNPALDEIQSVAALAARFWLSEGDAAVEELTDQKRSPASAALFAIAAAINFQAERQVDAAHALRDGLLAVADALGCRNDGVIIDRLAGIENELHRLANTIGNAFIASIDGCSAKGGRYG